MYTTVDVLLLLFIIEIYYDTIIIRKEIKLLEQTGKHKTCGCRKWFVVGGEGLETYLLTTLILKLLEQH